MEKENMELYQEVQENVAAQNRADTKTAEIFAFFDEVWIASCTAAVAVLPPTVGSDHHWFTDLRQVEGTSFGGYASVDAVDRGDSERY